MYVFGGRGGVDWLVRSVCFVRQVCGYILRSYKSVGISTLISVHGKCSDSLWVCMNAVR